jgi:hypothetical protein
MVGFIPNMAMMFGLFWAVFSKILPSSPGIYIVKASSEMALQIVRINS